MGGALPQQPNLASSLAHLYFNRTACLYSTSNVIPPASLDLTYSIECRRPAPQHPLSSSRSSSNFERFPAMLLFLTTDQTLLTKWPNNTSLQQKPRGWINVVRKFFPRNQQVISPKAFPVARVLKTREPFSKLESVLNYYFFACNVWFWIMTLCEFEFAWPKLGQIKLRKVAGYKN
jgi:hypothetical protein